MTRRMERLPSVQGKAAGQTATVNLPLGPTYHRFDVALKAAAASGTPANVVAADWGNYITDIRVIVDGNVLIEATAAFMVKRAQYFGQSVAAGILPIFLGMPWARTAQGEDQTAYGTASGMSSFTLEIDLVDGVEIGDLVVYAEQSGPQRFGPHLRMQRFAKSFGAIGTDEISDLPLRNYVLLNLDIDETAIGEVEILGNNRRVHISNKEVRQNLHNIAKRQKQAGYTHLDFMGQNRVNDAFPMVLQDFRLKLDFTTAPGAYSLIMTSLQGAASAA